MQNGSLEQASKIIIAIDGFSSCGKSTLAKALAKELSYAYVDTGAMYRATTLYFQKNSIILDNEASISKAIEDIHISFHFNANTGRSDCWLNGHDVEEEIRGIEVASHVSKVSQIEAVRNHLVSLQQAMGMPKGVVMDGRDIGTKVFPQAELKIFMTASIDVRVSRRFDEMIAKGQNVTREEVQKNLEERDYMDVNRQVSPLTQSPDAIVLDNSDLTPASQLNMALQWAQTKISEHNSLKLV